MSTWIELPAVFPPGLVDGNGAPLDVYKRAHITILYLGAACDNVDAEVLRKLARKIAASLPVEGVRARVDGYGTFIVENSVGSSAHKIPILLVNSVDLMHVRRACEIAVFSYGYPYASTYGFQPHVALRTPFELAAPFDLVTAYPQLVRKLKDETTFFEISQ